MGKHSKPKTNLQKFMNSPFMDLMTHAAFGLLIAFIFVSAI